ncbi:bestrophin family ion channel [Chryseobacterium indologenes]|uniref:bestrophin family protein n=1 Tax=Chryseobacterium indologenes TaxID=253 RepID=UPI0023E8D1FD|nr:bestrophin family ion channel [Chryseobacterium indologenes]WET49783.1 bestrophin family ion channel [Chryseobacterium indologenes]
MIIRKKEHWFKMLFVWHGSVLPGLLPRLFLLFILSLGVVYLRGVIFSFKIPLNPAPLTLFGFVLALFLGFRNNVSYDRFWEGRKLWGALLNTARSLTRQALTLKNMQQSSVSVSEFIQLLGAFIFALKHQLRGTDAYEDLKDRLNADQLKIVYAAKYKPAVILRLLAEWVQKAKEERSIDTIQQARFDENFDKLSDIVGGCERIVSTPLPYSYRVLLHRTVYIYCFLLPFGLVDSLRWLTPLIVVFVAYTFVAFEAIADEIEEPFGTEANDLALNTMSVMIEETIHEIAGEEIPVSNKEKQTIID